MEIYHETKDRSANDAFVRWRDGNSDGLFVNRRSPSQIMLHRSDCDHFDFNEKEKISLTKNMKVCSTDRWELESWAKVNGTQALRYCSHCKPI